MLTQTGLDSVIFKGESIANKLKKKKTVNIAPTPELPTSDSLAEPGKEPSSLQLRQNHGQPAPPGGAQQLPSSYFIFYSWVSQDQYQLLCRKLKKSPPLFYPIPPLLEAASK